MASSFMSDAQGIKGIVIRVTRQIGVLIEGGPPLEEEPLTVPKEHIHARKALLLGRDDRVRVKIVVTKYQIMHTVRYPERLEHTN